MRLNDTHKYNMSLWPKRVMFHTVIEVQNCKCIAIHYKSSGGQYCVDLMNTLSLTVFRVLVLKCVKPLDISDVGPQGLNICNLDTTGFRRLWDISSQVCGNQNRYFKQKHSK